MLSSPATLAVSLFLIIPVAATISVTFTAPAGLFAPYTEFFDSRFQRTVLWRTFEVAAITTVVSLVLGLLTAYVVSRCPPWMKSLLIVLAVFPLLTGVVVRSFAWLIILGRNGVMNNTLEWLGVIERPIALLYTQTSVVIALIYIFIPLMILVLIGVLENIPEDLLQASASLGASPTRTFVQVVLRAGDAGADRGGGSGLHGQFHLLCHAASAGGDAADDDGHLPAPTRHGDLRLGQRLDRRGDHAGGDRDHGSRDDAHRQAPEPRWRILT